MHDLYMKPQPDVTCYILILEIQKEDATASDTRSSVTVVVTITFKLSLSDNVVSASTCMHPSLVVHGLVLVFVSGTSSSQGQSESTANVSPGHLTSTSSSGRPSPVLHGGVCGEIGEGRTRITHKR